MNDVSVEEISAILEIPEGTVKSRLYYARRALRDRLEQKPQLVTNVGYEYN
jgi:DNA-directed RNA polymerase specialized sigma24 family protein